MFNGDVPINLPGSAAKDAAGNTFTFSGIEAEVHLFGAGAFTDTLTYMTQLTFADSGSFDIETAYLLWNDVVGPRHWLNLWVGRLWAPQLTSFGLHSDYLSDTVMSAAVVGGLYNPSASFTLGQGHTDGVELNGIVGHRFDYAVGWVASSTASGLSLPNAEDLYAHIGVKSGGVALDGEGKYGPNVPDPRKPWAEKSITARSLRLSRHHAARQRHGRSGRRTGDCRPAGRSLQRGRRRHPRAARLAHADGRRADGAPRQALRGRRCDGGAGRHRHPRRARLHQRDGHPPI